MLKHILTGQPATASRHQTSSNDHYSPGGLQALAANGSAIHQHQHQHQHQHLHQDQQHLHHTHHQHRVGGTIGTRGGSVDAYDSIGGNSSSLHNIRSTGNPGAVTTTPSSSHHHPLNHSQLSVNNLSQRLNHSHGLNLSTLSTSKHSVDSASPVVGANASNSLHHQIHHHPVGGTGHQISSSVDRHDGEPRPKVNGGLDITRLSRIPSHATPSPAPAPSSTSGALPLANSGPSIVPLNASITSSFSQHNRHHQAAGVKEMLTSLGLLCLVSLLLALLSLIFLLKISPLTESPSSLIGHDESVVVYEVTLALCALALSLNLCCLLVCAIQFLFAVKLVKSSYQGSRTNKYLQKSSISRVCAVGGFFISIPVFLTGMILYTFVQFHSTPAIVTSVFIGLGIIFCGCAMVHNVFVWQREKTNAIKALAREQCEAAAQLQRQQIQQQQQLQQQQQQHHQHHQKHHQHQGQSQHHSQRGTLNQSALSSGSRGGQKTVAIPQTHSTATLPGTHGSRGHPYHPHNHHHASVTPAGAQSHLQQIVAGSHRNIATPPTPGNLSPPSPSHKHNRSHVLARDVSGSVSPGLPTATLDLSSAANTNSPHELSTLV